MPILEPLFYLNAGKDGTFKNSGLLKSSPEQIDQLMSHLDKADTEKLIIYFHGGLVSEKSGLEAAMLMKDTFLDPANKRHVISFIWETGPKEVLLQNLDEITQSAKTSFYNEALKFVIKIAAKKLGLTDEAKGSGQYLDDATIANEKLKAEPFEGLDKEIGAKGGGADTSDDDKAALSKLTLEANVLIKTQGTAAIKNPDDKEKARLANEVFEEDIEGSRGLFSWIKVGSAIGEIVLNVLKRYKNNTHHDFYPTVVEETLRKFYLGKIGTWGWTEIKKKADTMFSENLGRSGDDLFVGSYLLSKLEAHASNRLNNEKKFTIELIGHSAGSIAICHLLKSVMQSYKTLKFNTIFFLAPACRVDLFLKYGVKAKEEGYFQKFKMFTMLEEYEKKDHCIPVVYTRSLLYLVSGLFEIDENEQKEIDAKIMGLNEQFKAEGRYSGVNTLQAIKAFLGSCNVALSLDDKHEDNSMLSGALKHGDFDNDKVTLESLKLSMI